MAWASAMEKARRAPVRKRVRTPWTAPSTVRGTQRRDVTFARTRTGAPEASRPKASGSSGRTWRAVEPPRAASTTRGHSEGACASRSPAPTSRWTAGPRTVVRDSRAAPSSATTQSANRPCSTRAARSSTAARVLAGSLSRAVVIASSSVHQRRVPGRLDEVRHGAGTALGRRHACPGGLEHHQHGGTRLTTGPQRGERRVHGNGRTLLKMDRETAVAVTACHRRGLRAERCPVGVREEAGERAARRVTRADTREVGPREVQPADHRLPVDQRDRQRQPLEDRLAGAAAPGGRRRTCRPSRSPSAARTTATTGRPRGRVRRSPRPSTVGRSSWGTDRDAFNSATRRTKSASSSPNSSVCAMR